MSLDVDRAVSGYQQSAVLRSVDVHVGAGDVVCVLGGNGAGKTTLARTLIGLLDLRAGTIALDGTDIGRLPVWDRIGLGLALVPEGRFLYPEMRVADNLLLGAYRRHRKEAQSTMANILDLFPVLRSRQSQRAGTLSGGEQQMLAIGRALMSRPRYLVLDEPSLGLAPLVVRQILDRIGELAANGVGILLVEQNAVAALDVSERAVVMERGQVARAGPVSELRADAGVVDAYLGR